MSFLEEKDSSWKGLITIYLEPYGNAVWKIFTCWMLLLGSEFLHSTQHLLLLAMDKISSAAADFLVSSMSTMVLLPWEYACSSWVTYWACSPLTRKL